MNGNHRQNSPKARLRLGEVVRQFLRFNLVGVLNTLVDFALFFLLTRLGMPYLLAQICSYNCGVANSYICNKYWTFGASGFKGAEVMRFAVVNVGAMCLSVLLVFLLHSVMNLSLLTAKGAATVFTTLVGFLGNRLWVFKPSGSVDA